MGTGSPEGERGETRQSTWAAAASRASGGGRNLHMQHRSGWKRLYPARHLGKLLAGERTAVSALQAVVLVQRRVCDVLRHVECKQRSRRDGTQLVASNLPAQVVGRDVVGHHWCHYFLAH